ncbi:hypothetical protein [Fulvimarina sp. MAC3]
MFEEIFGPLWLFPVSGLVFAAVGLTWAHFAAKRFDEKWGK